jgi:ABC-type lipoprotein export system ATPase subunit
MEALQSAVATAGSALLMVTHDRSLASQLSRIVVVRDGGIESGDSVATDQLVVPA